MGLRKQIAVGFLWAVIGLAGCSDLGTEPVSIDPPEPTVSFADDIQPIFAQNCVACHGIQGGMSLNVAVAWSNLVNMESTSYKPRLRVVPEDPAASVLYLKLMGDVTTGDRMPQGGSLAPAAIELIRVWIAEGALNN